MGQTSRAQPKPKEPLYGKADPASHQAVKLFPRVILDEEPFSTLDSGNHMNHYAILDESTV